MILTQKDIDSLVEEGTMKGMPSGTFVAGFEEDGSYFPVEQLSSYYAGKNCVSSINFSISFKGGDTP